MANHKSAKKRAKQTKAKTFGNKIKKSMAKTAMKKVTDAIEKGEKEKAKELLKEAQSLLFKAAKIKAVSSGHASRKTSILAQQISKLA